MALEPNITSGLNKVMRNPPNVIGRTIDPISIITIPERKSVGFFIRNSIPPITDNNCNTKTESLIISR